MRILLAASCSDNQTVEAVNRLLPRSEVVLTQAGDSAASLELSLRNALPDREVVTLPVQVVVDAEEPTAPRGILGLRSLRTLIEAGSLVICVFDRTPPVVIGETGKMEPVETRIAADPALELLARRLDAHPMALREAAEELGYARSA